MKIEKKKLQKTAILIAFVIIFLTIILFKEKIVLLADKLVGVKSIILLSEKKGADDNRIIFKKLRISSKNELIKFDNICEFSLPDIEMRNPYPLRPLRNLIEERNGNKIKYHFINGGDSHWIHYEIPAKNEIKSIIKLDFIGSEAFNNCFFTGINSAKGLLLLEEGFSYSTKKDSLYLDSFIKKDVYIRGSSFIGNDKIISQGLFNGDKVDNEVVPLKQDYDNMLQIYTLDNKEMRNLRFGYFPLDGGMLFTYMAPIEISPDNKYVFFLSQFDIDNYFKITLCSLDTENYSVSRLLDFERGHLRTFLPDSIKCCPIKDKNLILISAENSYILFDFKEKKLLKHLRGISPQKSVRWSWDGKKIGILTTDGEFYIYDIDHDQTKQILNSHKYFDFFWIPEK